MWLHIVIFVLVLVFMFGSISGWIPAEKFGTPKGRRLFLMVITVGNLAGMFLTATKGGGKIYSDGYMLEKEEDPYEEKFLVSVEGEKAGDVYIQVPEKESEEKDSQKSEGLTPEKAEEQKLLEFVEKYNSQKDDPDHYYLPSSWNGKGLKWASPYDNTGNLLAAMAVVAAFALIVGTMKEEQKARVKRYEELMMDYPGLILKFTLLVQAGMTVRNAFRKIAIDYKKKNPEETSEKKKNKSKQSRKKKAAYEEIVTTCYEMEGGISEIEAYRRLGERCGHVKYKTFATLLIQNLQKGSRQMGEMLEKESVEAWDDRKRRARVLGEAATTKLLVPMVLMLIVVMAIVMLPAGLSFYG